MLCSIAGFDSWSNCTPFEGCIGCSIEDQRNEAFPVFPALLNAVHQRKVTVRILTNDYNSSTCAGKIAPLDWLFLNGVEVRYYTSTTFMHSKYMMIDKGKKTSVSSVNFSYTSFMENREAGVVLSGACKAVINFYSSVFESDWNQGLNYTVNNHYNSSEMNAITDPSPIPVNVPFPPYIPGAYVTSLHNYSSVYLRKVYTAPDFARDTVFDTLDKTQASFYLMIYQVTDGGLCDELLTMHNNGIDVRLLVSDRIYDYTDWNEAQVSAVLRPSVAILYSDKCKRPPFAEFICSINLYISVCICLKLVDFSCAFQFWTQNSSNALL